jgi:hypothetical protein
MKDPDPDGFVGNYLASWIRMHTVLFYNFYQILEKANILFFIFVVKRKNLRFLPFCQLFFQWPG